MKTRMEYTCPLELTHDVTKGKWKPIILWQLGKGHRSLSSLKKEILGITQEMLMEQLKELLEYGMVEKHTYAGYPLHVEYYLTKRGEHMLEAIAIMQEIGVEMMLEDNREEFLKEKGLI